MIDSDTPNTPSREQRAREDHEVDEDTYNELLTMLLGDSDYLDDFLDSYR